MNSNKHYFRLGAYGANPHLTEAEADALWQRYQILTMHWDESWHDAIAPWPWFHRCCKAARRWLQEKRQMLRTRWG